MARTLRTPPRKTALRTNGDLSSGAIVVFSGGPSDITNPPEVRGRMNQFIADVNSDPYVVEHTNGKGLTYKLLKEQKDRYIHQTLWRKVCAKLKALEPSPLIVVGHSNGGAAAMSLARWLGTAGITVDLLFSADSVFTLDDLGDPNQVPSSVGLNVNPYVIPTPEFWLCPFPIGKANARESGTSLDRVVNIGLKYRLGGCIAHRNAFYEIAGGDQHSGGYSRPHLLLDTTLAVLRGDSVDTIFAATRRSLQQLATKSKIKIELDTRNYHETIRPSALRTSARSTRGKRARGRTKGSSLPETPD